MKCPALFHGITSRIWNQKVHKYFFPAVLTYNNLIFLVFIAFPLAGELYATLQTQEQHIYGHREVNEPNYCDPKGPKYDVSHYGSISVDQPVYNVVEDFTVKTTNRTEKGPNAMEPVYHELQDPCYDSSHSPEHMGTNEAFYNSLEESHQSSGKEDNHKDEVVYNTLEEPHTPDVDTEDIYGSGEVHEAFYNVLEEQ